MLIRLYQPVNHWSSLALWNLLNVTLGLLVPGWSDEVQDRATRIMFYPGGKGAGLGMGQVIFTFIFLKHCANHFKNDFKRYSQSMYFLKSKIDNF